MGFNKEATAPDAQFSGNPNQTKTNKKKNRSWMRKVWVVSCFQDSRLVGTTPREEQTAAAALAGEGRVDAHARAGPKPKPSRFWKRQAKQTVPVQPDSGHTEVAMDEGRKQEEMREREEKVKLAGQPAAVNEAKRRPLRRFFAKFRKKTKARRAGLAEPPAEEVEIVGSSGPRDSEQEAMGSRTSRRSGSPRARAGEPISSPRRTDRREPSTSKATPPSRSGGKVAVDGEETTQHSNAFGLAILVVLILAFLVGGRFFAILCTCTFFYLVPLFQPPTVPKPRVRKKKAVEVDYDSRQYKKSVVLEGLLERKRR